MKNHLSVLIGLLGVLPILSIGGVFAEREEPSTLRQQLLKVDALRAGASTQYAEVEKQGRALLLQYTRPEERAQIYFTIAEVYAQSDIRRHPERVTRYARLALADEHDSIRRGILYSYLGSAAEVDPTCLTFAEQRKQAARIWLQGYKELLPLHLPAVAPEMPIVEKAVDNGIDLSPDAASLKKHAEQRKARGEAERLGALVANRDIFVRQLTEVYGREPRADDELRHMAAKVLKNKQAEDGLLNQVFKSSGEAPVRLQ